MSVSRKVVFISGKPCSCSATRVASDNWACYVDSLTTTLYI